MRDALTAVIEGRNLTREQARAAMTSIMQGDATPGQIGGFLVAKNARQNVTIPQNSLVTLEVLTARRQAA